MMDSISERQKRTRLLLGDDLARLQNAHVLVLGVGGVGAYAAEQLGRAGIGTLTLVDGDDIEPSNCNRQLPALTSTLGLPKAEVMADRLKEINPAVKVLTRNEFIEGGKIPQLLDSGFDFMIDAIDSLTPKVEFLLEARRRKIPLVSSMGAGGRMDPSLITVADISKTHGCALARAVRSRLREHGVSRGLKVVFSPEPVPKSAIESTVDSRGKFRSTVGTISYLPAIFGCICASVVIRGLLSRE
ncbi:tRNA threonylcarbamoyladenosine dehydratase [uncultured Victivallis sp.]|uniref:tRNA threonylcarbamoyladenosine dehydratase n=1 Tax=uncultured Victivallis sp. TaxID=354118 RepID=UPI0025E807DF|nr:tRNA threonylcarbamoyladenosine dehydratase [uncultured Victivallis sp.]